MSRKNGKNSSFRTSILKIDFTQNLNDIKILQFLHCVTDSLLEPKIIPILLHVETSNNFFPFRYCDTWGCNGKCAGADTALYDIENVLAGKHKGNFFQKSNP